MSDDGMRAPKRRDHVKTQAPTRPRDVRLVYVDGGEVPVDVEYLGWDAARSLHLWQIGERPPGLVVQVKVGVFPAHTSIIVGSPTSDLAAERDAAEELCLSLFERVGVMGGPDQITCPRDGGVGNPCVARHGPPAVTKAGRCATCHEAPTWLLRVWKRDA